jgi:hypothetical protein
MKTWAGNPSEPPNHCTANTYEGCSHTLGPLAGAARGARMVSTLNTCSPLERSQPELQAEEKLNRRTTTSEPGKSGKNPVAENHRRRGRVKAVLPVRVSGSDVRGNSYSDLAHTLDVTETGVRLGAMHRELEVGAQLTLQYKQHRAEFRVVWSAPLPKLKERQVGLEAVVQRDIWGLGAEQKTQSQDSKAGGAPAPDRADA